MKHEQSRQPVKDAGKKPTPNVGKSKPRERNVDASKDVDRGQTISQASSVAGNDNATQKCHQANTPHVRNLEKITAERERRVMFDVAVRSWCCAKTKTQRDLIYKNSIHAGLLDFGRFWSAPYQNTLLKCVDRKDLKDDIMAHAYQILMTIVPRPLTKPGTYPCWSYINTALRFHSRRYADNARKRTTGQCPLDHVDQVVSSDPWDEAEHVIDGHKTTPLRARKRTDALGDVINEHDEELADAIRDLDSSHFGVGSGGGFIKGTGLDILTLQLGRPKARMKALRHAIDGIDDGKKR